MDWQQTKSGLVIPQEKPKKPTAEEIRAAYYKRHAVCPQCKDPDAEIEQTCMGAGVGPEGFTDDNRARCLGCGWQGIVHDLVPESKTQKGDGMNCRDIETWDDLGRAIAEMAPEQRAMPIQCMRPTPVEDQVQVMLPGIAIGTVESMQIVSCRSTHNNKYCPQDVVLLMDGNPFSEDGAIAFEWTDGRRDKPIYGKHGKTKPEEQRSEDNHVRFPEFRSAMIRRRAETADEADL